MGERALSAGITRAGQGEDAVVWRVLGHTYTMKAWGESCFSFETLDPPGTFVPLHIHPHQDEFIYMLEGTFDLQLGDAKLQASARRPRPHAARHSRIPTPTTPRRRPARCSGSRRPAG